jgi:MFS family permease
MTTASSQDPSDIPTRGGEAGSGPEPGNSAGFKNVVRLGYVSLFTDLSTEMILGLLPVFIHDQLGASYALIGLIEGSAEAVNDAFRILTGVITDRIARRKPLVLLGYALSSFAKPLFALTTNWAQAFIVRATDRAGKGARTSPRDALISDSIAKSQAGKAFGIHGSLDQVGAVLGPLIAFFAFPLIGFRGVFWLSFVPAVISLIILLFFVTEAVGLKKQRHFFENAAAVLNRRFVYLLVVLGIFSIGAYNFSFILLRASSFGIPDGQIPLVYVTINALSVVAAFPSGMLADRIGKLPVLFLSYLAFLVTSIIGIILVGNWSYGFVIAGVFGIYLGISDTVQRAMIPDFTKSELKGTAYAMYYLLVGASSFVANSIFGFLWTAMSSSVAFQYTLVTSVAGAVALVVFFLLTRSRKDFSDSL